MRHSLFEIYQTYVYLLKLCYSHFAYVLQLLQHFEMENVYGSM